MDSFLSKGYQAVTGKLGGVADYLVPLAAQLDVAVAEKDNSRALAVCEVIETRAAEMREALDAADELTAHVRQSLADGRLDLAEAGTGALKVERLIDELEDVVTGQDEDDAPRAAPGA